MEDIAPQLFEQLKKRFSESIAANPKIRALHKRIEAGKATYADAEEYAYLIGEALSQTFGKYLSSSVLPDGRMYFNIADRVLRPLLEEDHAIVSEAAAMVQTFLNQQAGIGIKAQTVAVNADRVRGIIDKVSNAEVFDDVAWVLDEPVKNFSMNVVDETLKANVNFQGRSGLTPKIFRKAERKCCDWCAQLAGEYDYPDVPDEVYQRHERCRCTVEYDPGEGRRQNVHTKRWTDSTDSGTLEARKRTGLFSSQKRPYEPDIVIGKDLGAKAKNYTVMDLETGEFFQFAQGTRIQNVEVFAGKGTRKEFRKAQKYADRYGGAQEDWQHVKGHGVIETPEGDRAAEVHWVQCADVGKYDFFVKRWEDE